MKELEGRTGRIQNGVRCEVQHIDLSLARPLAEIPESEPESPTLKSKEISPSTVQREREGLTGQ